MQTKQHTKPIQWEICSRKMLAFYFFFPWASIFEIVCRRFKQQDHSILNIYSCLFSVCYIFFTLFCSIFDVQHVYKLHTQVITKARSCIQRESFKSVKIISAEYIWIKEGKELFHFFPTFFFSYFFFIQSNFAGGGIDNRNEGSKLKWEGKTRVNYNEPKFI